jgi:hypothetical protein
MGQAAQRAPKKNTDLPLAGPDQARTPYASLPAALLPVDATHVASVPLTPAAISAKPPTADRPTGTSPLACDFGCPSN